MASGIKIKLNSKELDKQIKQAIQRNPKETVRAAQDCLLELAGRSASIAPVDTGDLRNDCTAELNGQTIFARKAPTASTVSPGLSAVGSVGYDLPYALRQHEELGYHHPHGGQAKYLEAPFNELQQTFVTRMLKVVDKSLK